MLDKKKTQKIIDKIFKNTIAFTPTELEWMNEEYVKNDPEAQDDDLWCRFFISEVNNEELTELLKHFNIYISSIDPKGLDKDSKLLHYYHENLKDKEDPMTLFQVQIVQK